MQLNVVILAAGQSKRMRSAKPKLLHTLAGKPILEHLINTVQKLHPKTIHVVYGHNGEQIRQYFANYPIHWVEQSEQLGTGHALAQAMPAIANESAVLVLLGDHPLIPLELLEKLIAEHTANNINLLTVKMDNPTGYGRIVRDQAGKLVKIVEEKDASVTERQIKEVNLGGMLVPAQHLKRWLPLLANDNQQQEYYLPDIVPLAIAEKINITTVTAFNAEAVQGVNDRAQLAKLERFYQRTQAEQLMQAGVTIVDPARFDLRGELQAAEDVTFDINVIVEGKVRIGRNSYVGPNTILRDVEIGENVTIKANCVIEEAVIANDCIVGPFARIRPGTHLAEQVHIGNFVEVKNAAIGHASKVNHLSYIGDASIGKQVNIGAGTITCNYDGINKHHTTIEDNVFIGSDTQLVAPVLVGAGATIGAGSTVTQDVPANALTLTHHLEQRTIPGWKRTAKSDKSS